MSNCKCNRRPDEPCCGKHYQNFGDGDERDEFTDQDVQARDEEAERTAKREEEIAKERSRWLLFG